MLKKILFVSIFLISFFTFARRHDVINPIVGNDGVKIGMHLFPERKWNEKMKVTAHLIWVEMLLRSRNTEHLNDAQKLNRIKLLETLHAYAMRGEYPKNEKFESKRMPCFIDDHGTICAVGYLIEQTEGRHVAEDINALYQYADVLDMEENTLFDWALENGVTLEELAMIQPNYDYVEPLSKVHLISLEGSSNYASIPFLKMALIHQTTKYRLHGTQLRGLGTEFAILPNNGYSLGLRGHISYSRNRWIWSYIGLTTEYFKSTKNDGFNLCPEIGILSNHFRLGQHLLMHAKFAYSYRANISQNDFYPVNRNQVSLGIGIGIRRSLLKIKK